VPFISSAFSSLSCVITVDIKGYQGHCPLI
jgi:hypothetical protein